MKRKLLAMTLVGITATTMIMSGCGGNSDTKEEGGNEGSKKEEAAGEKDSGKEMTYWSMWNSTEGQAKVIQEAAEAYEKETGIHINIEW